LPGALPPGSHRPSRPSSDPHAPPPAQDLDVSFNQIRDLPSDLSNLVDLEILNVACNPFRSLPAGVTRLHCLRELHVNHSKLEVGFRSRFTGRAFAPAHEFAAAARTSPRPCRLRNRATFLGC
jgi:hypothetical protein